MKTLKILIATMSLAIAAMPAQSSEFYAGAKLGQMRAKDFCRLPEVEAVILDSEVPADSMQTSCDDRASGAELEFGWEINDYFALETGFVKSSDFNAQVNASYPGAQNTESYLHEPIAANMQGVRATMVGIWPVSGAMRLKAKLGLLSWKTNFTLDVYADNEYISDVSVNEDRNGTGLTFGLGGEYRIGRHWGVTLDWERFKDIGIRYKFKTSDAVVVDETFKGDIDMVAAGAHFRF